MLPGRVPEFQPRWLDEAVAAGEWAWVCRQDGDSGPGLLAFWRREDLGRLPPPALSAEAPPLDAFADRLLESLRRRGACFVTDLAGETQSTPASVRAGLWALLRRGLVTNDHLDVIRRGEEPTDPTAGGLRRRAVLVRRPTGRLRPEGRWSLAPWGQPDREAHAIFLAHILLRRHGIVARELALLDPGMAAWRILCEVLSRMELVGEVRRGYFIEGLSVAQFALPAAARLLQEVTLPSTAAAPVVLAHSLDPANLYSSGTPFDIPLLDGGSRPLLRRAGNWLALRAGRPVLIVEQQGKRLTALASASEDDLAQAVALLPATLTQDRGLGVWYELTVAEWNGQPVTTTPGKDYLEAAGFVRD